MEEVIATYDLTRSFGTFTAVNKLNLSVKRGEIYGFLGPNGAGKSTAIRMLCGILQPTSGNGRILGYDLLAEAERIKQNIGYMSQKFSLYDDLSVEENLNFYAGVYEVPYKEMRARVAEMVAMAGLTGREKEVAANLSGGWKQRLALGCAIISRPSLVFLDEPTSGVSPTSRRMFFNIIRDMADNGITVMVTTHFMDEAERCNRIAFISGGRMIAVDTPENLKKQSIQGYLVELAVPDAPELVDRIGALPYVRECNIHGPLLHILLADERNTADIRALTGAEPKPITPSLEDVFVTLAKQQREGEQSCAG